MRVASMLFERGLLIRGDKMFAQDLVLQNNERVCAALEAAERDGNVVPLEAALASARGGKKQDAADSDSDSSVPGHAPKGPASKSSFAMKGQGQQRQADSDDEGEDITAIDARRESFRAPAPGAGTEAPHPAAGGLTMAIPPGMGMERGKFVGNILMRISSKKMFRKWKSVFFVLDRDRLVVWNDRREAELGGQAPRMVFPVHECMWIAKPMLKKTYSLIDDGRRVYFTTVKENPAEVLSDAVASGMERPVAFTPALEARVVAKFGSHVAGDISAFAHALYGCVRHHQREAEAARAKGKTQSNRYG